MKNSHRIIRLTAVAICAIMALTMVAVAANVSDGVSPNAHDVEYKRELVNREKFLKVPIGKAGGQPRSGWYFTQPTWITWSDGGNKVDVSLSVSWGVVNASISAGKASSSGSVVSVSMEAPMNQYCYLYIHRDIVCERYANYERLRGSTGAWRLVDYDEVVYADTPYYSFVYD